MLDDQKRGNIDDVIEKAMSRLAERSPEAIAADEQRERKRLGLGRRDYDQVLADRLEDLRAMTGSGEATLPLAQPPASPGPASQRNCHRTGPMLVAILISAVAGAGAMRLALPGNPQPTQWPVPATAAAPARPELAEVASVAPAPKPGDEDQVRELMERWRSAWAGRDVEAYLATYSADFTPANGQKHDAWVAARRKNISSRSNIAVGTNDLKLERLDARQMKARFLQDYASDAYRETAQAKTLLLVRSEAGWKIAGEWQGEAAAGAIGKP
jgi:hypothetical protein